MSKETVEKWNDAFERVYPGPTQRASSIRVDVGDEAFKATWGGKTLADVQRENDKTVNALFDKASKENDIGSVFEKREKNVVSDEDFERTYGMTKEEAYERSLDYINKMAEKEKINKEKEFGRVFERDENSLKEKALASGNAKSMVDAGGVFEKQDKEVKGFDQNSLDNNSIKATGIDPETLDRLKKEIDEKEKAHNNEIKHHDTIKGPSLPSMDFVK